MSTAVDGPGDTSSPAGRAGIARSSIVVASGTFLSRITGLLRVIVLAAVLGEGLLGDTYNLANTTPNILYELVLGGVLAATLVPVFVDRIEHDDERATSAIFTVSLTVLVGFTLVVTALSPVIAHFIVLFTEPAKRAAQLHTLTVFLVCFVPQIVFYGFTALASALLNAHRRFVAAAFAPVVNNVVVIAILLVFAHHVAGRRSAIGSTTAVHLGTGTLLFLGIGTTAGIVLMAATLAGAMWHGGMRLHAVFAWTNPAIRTILRLSGWTVGYVVANQIAQLFVLILANRGATGRVSAYVYAFTFYQVPHGLLAVSIMTAIGPELARRATANDRLGFLRDLRMGLRYTVVLVLPASVLFAVLAQPMLGVIVHGKFTVHDATVTGDTLQVFALSLVPFSVYLFTMRGFYALQNTRTPFFVNLFENSLNVVFALALYWRFGVQGLALAWGLAYLIASVAAFGALGRRIGAIADTAVLRGAAKAAIAAVALAAVAAPIAGAIGHDSPGRALTATVVAGGAGVVAYIAALALLRTDELRSLVDLARRRTPSPRV